MVSYLASSVTGAEIMTIEQLTSNYFFNNSIINRIFLYLSPADLKVCQIVCKQWKNLAIPNKLEHFKFLEKFKLTVPPSEKDLYISIYFANVNYKKLFQCSFNSKKPFSLDNPFRIIKNIFQSLKEEDVPVPAKIAVGSLIALGLPAILTGISIPYLATRIKHVTTSSKETCECSNCKYMTIEDAFKASLSKNDLNKVMTIVRHAHILNTSTPTSSSSD